MIILNRMYGKETVGGYATIKVSAPSGLTVTATKGTDIVAGVWNGEYYTISGVSQYGNWTVSNGVRSTVVDVEEAKTYEISLPVHMYEQLDYLEATGTQYINTGINGIAVSTLAAGFLWNVEMALTDSSNTNSVYPFGSLGKNTGGTYQTCIRFYRQGGSSYLNRIYIHKSPYERYVNGYTWNNNFHTYELRSNGAFYVDNVSKTLTNGSTGAKAGTIQYPVYLFEENQSNVATSTPAKKIRKAIFYNGSTVLRNYVPVRRLSDNELGMLDTENNVFYGNDGTGTFNAGSVVGYID